MLKEILENIKNGIVGKPANLTTIIKILKEENNFNENYIKKAFDPDNPYSYGIIKGWVYYLFPNEKSPADAVSMFYYPESKYNTLKNKVKKIKQQLLDKLNNTKTNSKFEYLNKIESKIKKEIKEYCNVREDDYYLSFKNFKETKSSLIKKLTQLAINDIIKFIEKNYKNDEYDKVYEKISKIDSSIYVTHDKYTQVYGDMGGKIYGKVKCDAINFEKKYILKQL